MEKEETLTNRREGNNLGIVEPPAGDIREWTICNNPLQEHDNKTPNKEEVTDFLYQLTDDLMSHGAWSGHCYSFEYLDDDYDYLLNFMKENKLNYNDLASSYNSAKEEYERILDDPDSSFLRSADVYQLDMLDGKFFDEIVHSAQAVITHMQIEDEWLRFA